MERRRLQLEISGGGVFPETTPASDLADFIRHVEVSILETAKAEGAEIPEEAMVSLVSVDKGSNKLTIAVASTLALAASILSGAVRSNNYDRIPVAAHTALHEISKQAVKRKWTVKFVEEPSLRIEPAVISEDHQVPPPPLAPSVSGTTTIYGRCVRVGGAGKPRAEIRLFQGKLLHIDVSEDLAKKLGKSLYEEVCIDGKATWRTDNWTLENFEVVRITQYQPTDPLVAFEQLAKAAKGRWDGVDVYDYMRSLRDQESEP